jgi:hypothetical protein
MQGAFFGCRTVLVSDAAALCDAHEPHELDESAEIEETTIGSLIHRGGSVRVCAGDGCETHVSERLTVKRARHAMLVEATVHALAHRAAPDAVTPMLYYLRAPGDLGASAIVSRTHGIDGSRFLRDAPSTDACVEWTASIARTVAAFGAARIVHGDLKLNNTCVADGAWRVIDFGHSGVHGVPRIAPEHYIYDSDAAGEAPFNASFDMRVFIWSCVVHAAEPDAWRPWLSRFECAYPVAWRRYTAARRSGCARLRVRALHAMYQPVYAEHDAEFEPERVLDTIRVLRSAQPACGPERDGGAVLDAP